MSQTETILRLRGLEIAHSLQSRGQMKKVLVSHPRDNIKHIYIGLKLSAEDLKEKLPTESSKSCAWR